MVFICKLIQVRINSLVGVMIGHYHLTKTDQNFNNTLTSLRILYTVRGWDSFVSGFHYNVVFMEAYMRDLE